MFLEVSMKKALLILCVVLTVMMSITVGVEAASSDYTLSGTTFTVYTANGLMDVAAKINSSTSYATYNVNIAANINMSGKSWIPIGKNTSVPYKGVINGGGYTISNLTAVGYGSSYLGFVGVAGSGATVKNLNLTGVNFDSNKTTVGGIMARVEGTATISGCTVSGTLRTADNYVAGLVGTISTPSTRLTISNCAVDADIYAANHSAAGIVGGDNATSSNAEDIDTYPKLSATNVFITGNLRSPSRMGSFMGYNSLANVSFVKCISLATVNSEGSKETGSFIAIDNQSKIYLKDCMAFCDLPAFYYTNKSQSIQTTELSNSYLLKNYMGKPATIATYNQYKYCKYVNDKADYYYSLIADVIVDGVGAKDTYFTTNNKSYRYPVIQYNVPSKTESEMLTAAYSAAMSMFTDSSAQEKLVHKHSWGTGVVEKAATYTSTGITAYECTKCNACKRVKTDVLESTMSWSYNSTTKTLTISGSGTMGKFHTADTVPWKQYRADITKIVIESGITDISDYAFYNFTALESITIPSTVKVIGAYSFHNCRMLRSLSIPTGVTTIHDHAFEYCSALDSINIPSSVTKIGYGVFRFAGTATPTITCSSSAYTVINNCLVEDATNSVIAGFANSIIPESVTAIGRCAFQGCTGLTNITIPESVTNIDIHAFADCTRLVSITLPSTLTKINEGVFSGCSRLNNVVLPSTVTSVGKLAFYGCIGLEKITFGASSTTVAISAFDDCLSLVKVSCAASCANYDAWVAGVSAGNELFLDRVVPTHTYSGVTCSKCGELKPLELASMSLSLRDSIAMYIKIDESYFKNGYTFSKLVINFEGKTYTITSLPKASGGKHAFLFENIYPRLAGSHLTVTLYAKYGGTTYQSVTRELSVEDYCYAVLNDPTLSADVSFRKLTVDLLNYVSAAQLYAGEINKESTYLAELPNYDLNDTQKGYATQQVPTLTKTPSQSAPAGVSGSWTAKVKWATAALRLEDTVMIKLGINTSGVTNLSGWYVKATTASNTTGWTIPQSEWVTDGYSYIYFDGLSARQMREDVYFTVYDANGNAVSNTLTYSIEAYVKTATASNSANEATKRLLIAMMAYGDSAAEYLNN